VSPVKAVQVPTRVVVCGPATALEGDPAFDVVRADSPEQVRERIAAVPVDCLVVGLEQAGGADGLRELRTESPSTAFVVLAEDEGEVREAIRAGAHRCLPAGDLSGPMLRVAVTEAIERRAAGVGPAAASDETVRRLARAIELRNPETSSHIERMSCYCALLAEQLGLDAEMTRVAARLHDLGKVVVPDSILLKPGPLTPTERREMERHAEVGRQLLQGSRIEFLDFASLIAWTHHERFDGTGYPRRLAGEEIPLAGRIAGLADAFDALSTDRVYRTALPFDDALAIVHEERERQFDPGLVDLFVDQLDEVRGIMERNPDDPAEQPATHEPELVTLQEAATTLGVSQSRLRRWSDEGRIEAVRTAGGHRRFPLDAVRRLAAELGTRPGVRPAEPPSEPLPALSQRLTAGGHELAAAAAGSLYKGGQPGWFATPDAARPLAALVTELRESAASGRYSGAFAASDALMRRAYLQGAGLLERHSFLDRFSAACQRALTLAGARREEVIGTRRLFAALQQSQLAGRP
jgi:excisionase family DNA binding protein